MYIVCFLNPKGGSGKSTLAACLASGLAEASESVIAIDTDPQGTLTDWQASDPENPIPLVQIEKPNNLKTLQDLAATYGWAVIDGAGRTEEMTGALIRLADLAITPVVPSAFDLWATNDLVEAIQERQEITGGQPQARFLVSRAGVHTRLGQEVVAAAADLGLPLMGSRIHQRQAYPRTTGEGRTPLTGNDPSAKHEIRGLTREVIELVQGGQ